MLLHASVLKHDIALTSYHTIINQCDQCTLFLGMHRVKMYHLRRKVHFVIMTSVFDTPEKIHTVYDLKGSLIGTTYIHFD
jgi:hypothetical protein